MSDDRLEAVLSGPRLPSLPAVAVRVLQLAESPDASLGAIAEAIEFDQALVARLLRTVNSSYYGLQRPCANIEQAMAFLGLRAVRSLVLGFSLAKSLDGGGADDVDFPWRDFWRRSIRMAVAARLLAARVKGLDPDEAQTAGFLADLGVIALFRAYGDRYLQTLDMARSNHARLSEFERRAFETTHHEVSELMMAKWNLPAEFAAAVGSHETPPARAMDMLAQNTALAALAERAAGAGDERQKARDELAFERACESCLGLSSAAARQILGGMAVRVSELAQLLELDIGPDLDPKELVRRARALRDPGNDDGTRSEIDAIGHDALEERLAEAFTRNAGVAAMVIESDRPRRNSARGAATDVPNARLQAVLDQAMEGVATLHELTPTLYGAVIELSGGAASERQVVRLAERVRTDVESRRIGGLGPLQVTVSIGVAIHGERRFDSPDGLLRAAMLALGAAQRGGRNRVGHFKQAHDACATIPEAAARRGAA